MGPLTGKTVGDPNPQTSICYNINMPRNHFRLRNTIVGGGTMRPCLLGGQGFDSVKLKKNFIISFHGHMVTSGLAMCHHMIDHPKGNILWNIFFLIFSKIKLFLVKCDL